MNIDEVNSRAELIAMGDQLTDPEGLPWVPQADGVYFRPLRINPELGTWTNLLPRDPPRNDQPPPPPSAGGGVGDQWAVALP